MTPHDLIAAFETLADAPDGVQRLRELVLSLAVRGKLVPQHPDEGSGARFYDEVERERARGVADGSLRDSKDVPLDPPPFELPSSWSWVPLGHAVYIEMGQSPPSSAYNQSGHGMPFFQGKADFGEWNPSPRYWCTEPTKLSFAGDVLLSIRAPVGPTNVSSETCCIGRGLAALRPLAGMPTAFVVWSMRALERELERRATGTTFVAVSKKDLVPFPFPLPPLAEQRRIVARVDELMGLLDRLEAARATRDAVRRAARDAALADLRDAPDAEAVEAAWSRIARQMDDLFAEPEDVAPLRQAILQLAVRGRLVAQEAGDEPASVLLKKLKAESVRLVQAKAIRRPSPLPPVQDADKVFRLPDGWEWARLQDVGDWGAGATPLRGDSRYFGGSVNWFKSGELPDGPMTTDSEERITQVALAECSLRQNQPGDVLIAMYGATIGKLGLLEVQGTTNQAVCACTCFEGFYNRYLFLVLLTWRAVLRGSGEGGAQPNISKVKIVTTAVPVPPLSEQHRIVAKVDALMALCDDLEARLTATRDLHGQFAGAAVHHLDV